MELVLCCDMQVQETNFLSFIFSHGTYEEDGHVLTVCNRAELIAGISGAYQQIKPKTSMVNSTY